MSTPSSSAFVVARARSLPSLIADSSARRSSGRYPPRYAATDPASESSISRRWDCATVATDSAALRERVNAYGPAALDAFYAAALRLTSGRAADWNTRWRAGALATAALTGDHLAEIGAQVVGHLGSAGLWRIDPPDGPRGYGMCGRLTPYPAGQATQVG